MRTTIILDEDLAAKLRAEARRTGKPFNTVLNECLRSALAGRSRAPAAPFRIEARDLGHLRASVSLDSIAELLDRAESPEAR